MSNHYTNLTVRDLLFEYRQATVALNRQVKAANWTVYYDQLRNLEDELVARCQFPAPEPGPDDRLTVTERQMMDRWRGPVQPFSVTFLIAIIDRLAPAPETPDAEESGDPTEPNGDPYPGIIARRTAR